MHIGDRVRNRINRALGRVASMPTTTPGSITVLQNDATTAPWPIGDAEVVKPIAELIAEQEEVLEGNMRTVHQAKTEQNQFTLESASARLRQLQREARGLFSDD
ncbi:hypothetical protein WME95_26975 [Sorangium sp. So ce327]|jgi:hypothetical protein|uniref:hypothetical protein n=1 Tax=Sorangium sp. So ce327 TaxID=3133301 RepID=UPI003F614CC0